MSLTGTSLFSAAAYTIHVPFKHTTAGAASTYRAAVGLRHTGDNKQVYEAYQNEATDLQSFHKGTNGTTNVDDQLENDDHPNAWRHLCITSDSDGNPLEIYYIAEGFNQGSPSYLFRSSDTTNGIYNSAGACLLALWHYGVAGGDLGSGVRLGRVIVYASAHSEADVLSQMKSQAAIHSSPAVIYPMNSAAAVGTDISGNGRNATVTNSGDFSDSDDAPSDWQSAPSCAPTISVAATGGSLAAAAASSAPTITVEATGKSLAAADASCAPTITVDATSSSESPSDASSAPTITVEATGASLAASAASCAPTITVEPTGHRLAAAAASCAPTISVAATGVTAHTNFPLASSSDDHYLVTPGGEPFRIKADSAWEAICNLSLSELRDYLDARQAQGVNALILQITNPKPYTAGSTSPAAVGAGGALPFLLNISATTWDGDPGFANFDAAFSSPNPTYFAWVDTFLSEMATRGMLAIIDYNYMGFNNGATDGWWQTLTNAGNTQAVCFAYGQYLGGRYKLYGNILWKTGTDMFPTPDSEGETRHLKILQGIQDAGDTHLVTGHWKASSKSDDEANFASLMTVNAVYAHGDYGTPTTSHNGHGRARLAYAVDPAVPSFFVEGQYEGEHSSARYQLRSEWWGTALSCIGGTTMGNGTVWTFDTGWETELTSNGAADFEVMNDGLDAVPWYRLVPNGLGSIGTLITAGGGTAQTTGAAGSNDGNNGLDYVVAAATANGSHLIAYIPDGHAGSVTIDMTKLGGTVRARWYDPTDGSYTAIATYPNTGTQAFTPTGANAAGDDDWVLLLEAGSAPSCAPTISVAATGGALVAAAPSCAPTITVDATGSSSTGSAATCEPTITVEATGKSLAASAASCSPFINVAATSGDGSSSSETWRPDYGPGSALYRPGWYPEYA